MKAGTRALSETVALGGRRSFRRFARFFEFACWRDGGRGLLCRSTAPIMRRRPHSDKAIKEREHLSPQPKATARGRRAPENRRIRR